MKTKKILIVLLCATMFFAFSCSKEGPQGPAGPQGEQGITGETGPRGATGAKGEKGDPGTANVIYSDWLTVKFTGSISFCTGVLKAPELSSAILNKGNVVVYSKIINDGDSTYYKLNIYTRYLKVSIGQLKVGIIRIYSNTKLPPPAVTFRYILIPGRVHARKSSPPPNFNDYHTVCEYYGIPE